MNSPALKRRNAPRRKPIKLTVAQKKGAGGPSWLNEAVSVLFFGAALFLAVSFLTVTLGAQSSGSVAGQIANPLGPVGAKSGALLAALFGWSALVPVPS